jgi:hypothetical protein
MTGPTPPPEVKCHRHDGWAELVLNRPERRNAIDGLLADGLLAHLTALRADEGVRAIEGLGLAQGGAVVRVDGAVRVMGEEDDATETMALREEAGEHGHGLLGAILLIAGQEDDGLARAGALAAREVEPAGAGGEGLGGGERHGAQREGQEGTEAVHGVMRIPA